RVLCALARLVLGRRGEILLDLGPVVPLRAGGPLTLVGVSGPRVGGALILSRLVRHRLGAILVHDLGVDDLLLVLGARAVGAGAVGGGSPGGLLLGGRLVDLL